MSELYGTVGTRTYKQLLSDPERADVISVPVAPGNGTIAIGTLLARSEAGLYAPAKAADVTETAYLVVAGEDIESGEAAGSGETATAADAKAYRSGCFVDGAVVLADGTTPTAAAKVILRKQGIVFDPQVSTETFDNTVKGA